MAAVEKLVYYTNVDYKKWDGDWELINGVPYCMAPAATPKHQRVGLNIIRTLSNFLKGKKCQVFYEIDVVFAEETTVRPDIVVVCDKTKINNSGCKGAPDLAVEILSPSTAKRDKTTKLRLYRDNGVREYWIVDPTDMTITVHNFVDKIVDAYSTDDEPFESSLFGSELKIDVKEVFEGIEE